MTLTKSVAASYPWIAEGPKGWTSRQEKANDSRVRRDSAHQTRIDKLFVSGFDHHHLHKSLWECMCDCDRTLLVPDDTLKHGKTTSCRECWNKSGTFIAGIEETFAKESSLTRHKKRIGDVVGEELRIKMRFLSHLSAAKIACQTAQPEAKLRVLRLGTSEMGG